MSKEDQQATSKPTGHFLRLSQTHQTSETDKIWTRWHNSFTLSLRIKQSDHRTSVSSCYNQEEKGTGDATPLGPNGKWSPSNMVALRNSRASQSS